MNNTRPQRALKNITMSIFANSRGFGYALMKNSLDVLDAKIITIRPVANQNVITRIKELIDYYEPQVVVLEKYDDFGIRKSKRIMKLIDLITDYVEEKNHQVFKYSRKDIRFAFSNYNAHTKYEIACVIAQNVKTLNPLLMEPRKVYESEKYTTGVFDAVSLGFTHFYLEG